MSSKDTPQFVDIYFPREDVHLTGVRRKNWFLSLYKGWLGRESMPPVADRILKFIEKAFIPPGVINGDNHKGR